MSNLSEWRGDNHSCPPGLSGHDRDLEAYSTSTETSIFFCESLLEWFFTNLCEESAGGRCSWSTLFVVAVWWAWKWRCDDIFGGMSEFRNRVRFLKDLAQEVFIANMAVTEVSRTAAREERLIA